jgi:general secretion pathway protein F
MPAFQFEALDGSGQMHRGVLQADTARGARSALRERGLFPVAVEAVDARRRRLSLGTVRLALLLRQLAVLVRAGLPLDEALAALAEQDRRAAQRGLLLALRARLMEGRGLAQAMGEFPDAFPELVRAAVAAAEQAGRLPEVLERLAELNERRSRLLRRVAAALAYPILLTVVALAVVVGLLAHVVPEVTQVFAGLGGELPAPTRALLALSAGLKRHGPTLLLALAALALLGFAFARLPRFRPLAERLLLATPGLGLLRRRMAAARLTRTLAVLAEAAVPLLEAMQLARATLTEGALRAQFDLAIQRVREGGSLSRALAATGLMPLVAMRLIAGGERSGRLAEMLERAAGEQENDLDLLFESAAALVGPLAILAIGGLVLFIVLAILLPIFELNQMLR